jgi:outer membrane protein TolC
MVFLILIGLGLVRNCIYAQPANQPGMETSAPRVMTLQEAMERARINSPQLASANITALLAHEDRVQAKAALLPNASWFNQFIYTQPNGTPSGVFVANDGPHVYNNWATAHGDIFAPGKRAEYQRTIAAEAVSRAKADIAGRGLIATVVQNYYGLVSAQRKYANAQQSLREAGQFTDITQKQEQGGEVAHSDVVKAQIQLAQRQRDAQEAQVAIEKARIGFAVILFPDFRRDYSVVDDLQTMPALPPFEQIQGLASKNSPDIRAAQSAVRQETLGITVARSAYLPQLSFDYFFGINANQYAIYNRSHLNNLGSVAQAQMTIPLWTWGATRSKIKQAQLHLQQAKNDLSLTQRTLLANLNSFYLEADTASSQLASLKNSLDLSTESLRLTLLRYQAGEVTVLEVVDAQTTLVQARNAYDDGVVRYRLALANLQTLTGAF